MKTTFTCSHIFGDYIIKKYLYYINAFKIKFTNAGLQRLNSSFN